VIGLHAYTLHIMIIFVLICTMGINAVREVMWWWTWFEWFSVRRHSSMLKLGAVRWICRYYGDEVLSPVATRRRLVSVEYFGCLLIKHFISVYVFFKENLKRWLVCFSSARLIHQKKIINYLAVWHNLHNIFSGNQPMVKVRNTVEMFRKISTAWVGCTTISDRQTTDGRAIAYSERKREFTFAKM